MYKALAYMILSFYAHKKGGERGTLLSATYQLGDFTSFSCVG